MHEYPANIRFKYPWRKYQQRVLDDLHTFLTDKSLHIIAPPGSGKTILGLEVALRLNKPTLILAPTIAIRNQWVHRFCELFLQTNHTPEWISTDIRNPKFLTVATYQALHAAAKNWHTEIAEPDEEDEHSETSDNEHETILYLDQLLHQLAAQQIQTIVVDEAHHLKNEWWQTLARVREKLSPAAIVGLTATPPYDVSDLEWQRYLELNGPVDAEISVPELVIEGDLCPHQDYVFFCLPTEKELNHIAYFRDNIEHLFKDILTDNTLAQALEAHPAWQRPQEHTDWISNNLSSYYACLIYLYAMARDIPDSHLDIIGVKEAEIPLFNYEWVAVLLDFYLFIEKKHFKAFEEHRKSLENKLKRAGALKRHQISFIHNKRVTSMLSSSIGKLEGIREIVEFEYRQLGNKLRLVVLTDFIRKDFFVETDSNHTELNKVGVVPIFEKLRRENNNHIKIGVLTGSLVIIPASALPAFEARTARYGMSQIMTSPVPFDPDYLVVHQNEQLKHDMVHVVTQIFQAGEIEVLIGTKSLLGEGWDAPAINALVLASFVGSFVISNQMRGRAIRIQDGNALKTGNIWHLACLDPTLPDGGGDVELLRRRFKCFTGVSFKEEPGIENGIGRLNLPDNMYQKEVAQSKNADMFAAAADRETLKQRWDTALAGGVNLVEEITIPFVHKKKYKTVTSLYLKKTIANLIATLSSSMVAFFEGAARILVRSLKYLNSPENWYMFISFIGTLGMFYFGGKMYKTFRLYLKYRDIAKDIHHIGEALLFTLIKAGVIQTNVSKLEINTSKNDDGVVFCHLTGGTSFEKTTFINAMQEIVAPIRSPKYVIVRKSRFLFFVIQRDFHAVPEILARNKHIATYFKAKWAQFAGSCELVYTRTVSGRKLLLKARAQSLAAQLADKTERVNKWV